MIDLSRVDELLDQYWSAPLHLVDIDAGIEHQRLACDLLRARERQRAVSAAGQHLARIEARPAKCALNVEFAHFKSRA